MLEQPSSPENLYATFSSTVGTIDTGVKTFARLVNDTRTQEMLKRAKESRAANAEGINSWDVTEHEDWLEVHGSDSPSDGMPEDRDDKGQDNGDNTTLEGLQTSLQKFQQSHPSIESSLEEDSKRLKVI